MRKLKYLSLILVLSVLMFAQYEIPIENLLTNSGFGVWSQSDANKGIAVLNYDAGTDVGGGDTPDVGDAVTGATSTATGKIVSMTITAGTFPGDNAAGAITLGAVTGTFQDNETINFTDLETALVNGDSGVGIKNDPMNNDSQADWTKDANLTLAFDAGNVCYDATTNGAGNQRAWLGANASVTTGKIYIIELDIRDGTDSSINVQGYFDDGAAQYGKSEVTIGAWASKSWTFECATTTATGKVGFRIVEDMTGSNIEVRRFSCYEITPGCTGADAKALDAWMKDTTIDIYREHDGANTKDGSFYAFKMVITVASDYVQWPGLLYDNEEWYMQFQGRTVTKGGWVKTSTANHAKLRIADSAGSTDSSYHTGGGTYEWLEVTRTIDGGATSFEVFVYGDVAGTIDGNTIIYASQPIFSFQSSIGSGNYSPRQHEMIWLEKEIISNKLNNWLTISDTGWVLLNIGADTNGCLPKGCKEMLAYSVANDSGSANNICYLKLRVDATSGEFYVNSVYGIVDNKYKYQAGAQGCNSDGDVEYFVNATGIGTFNIITFKYKGVRVTD